MTATGVRGGPSRSIKIGRGVRGGLSRSMKIGRGKSDRGNRRARSGTRGLSRSIKIGRGKSDRGNKRLRVAPLLSAVVRSSELRLAQARVALGSPKLGKGEEGATTNSMAGKRP
jgi:hypothetical protein